ncbi:MAG: thiol reductase thioredoxin [Flavobacteriaceae bacterium]|nr:thiol reductase thioredoxin [Flavobacteriaceae bacterium]
MKKYFMISFFILLLGCSSNLPAPIKTEPIESADGEMILLGAINQANLITAEITPWFKIEYDRISIDPKWADSLKPYTDGLSIKIFMGTWCEDSQREIPHLFKILNALDVDHRNLEMYAMATEKITPSNFEKGLNITNVPTFIFYKNGNEMNRFVELPVENLAQDIAKIIKGETYHHSYK